MPAYSTRISEILNQFGIPQAAGLAIHTPITGEPVAQIASDSAATVAAKAMRARAAQAQWRKVQREQREAFLSALAQTMSANKALLGEMITIEAGKIIKEGIGEAEGAANILNKTMADAKAAEALGAARERLPVGVVGLITSFNFPLAVAYWTIAPALLAGNTVLWKPSEKTPLVALICEKLFQQAAAAFGPTVPADLLQLLIGAREIGTALVADEQIDLISATGSVAMGKGIRATLTQKKNKGASPILELGGNNAVIFSASLDDASLEAALKAVLESALGTTGQRCTDTRRLFVPHAQLQKATGFLRAEYQKLIDSGTIGNVLEEPLNRFGYGPLIDRDAFVRYLHALREADSEDATVFLGEHLLVTNFTDDETRLLTEQHPKTYYVRPALAVMPTQEPGSIMFEETFAPVLFIAPYDNFEQAIAMANAPENGGLVGALYTIDRKEAERFAEENDAGHSVINSPTGTGTPAHGLGFGGNKASGEGVILAPDPLCAFTRSHTPTPYIGIPCSHSFEPDATGKVRYVLKRKRSTGESVTRVVIHPTLPLR